MLRPGSAQPSSALVLCTTNLHSDAPGVPDDWHDWDGRVLSRSFICTREPSVAFFLNRLQAGLLTQLLTNSPESFGL